MRFKSDARLTLKPPHQGIDGGVCHRLPMRPAKQVDEDVVGIQVAIFDVEVVGIQPDQFGAHRDGARVRRFSARTISAVAPADGDFPFGDGDVLMPKPQGFTDPDTGVMEQREQQPVPEMSARIQDALVSALPGVLKGPRT